MPQVRHFFVNSLRQQFPNTPDVTGDTTGHRRRDSQRSVNSAKIVLGEMERQRRVKVGP